MNGLQRHLGVAAMTALVVGEVIAIGIFLTTATIAHALGVIGVFALALHAGSWSHFVPFVAQRAGSDPLPGALAPAMIGGFFAFGGWWEIAKLGGEAKDPARTMPRALALGVIVVTAIYVLTSAVFLYLVPLDRVTSGETFAAQAGAALFGPSGGRVFAAIVIVAILGSLFALLMALPRVYYAMARDGVFFKGVATVHPRFGTPVRAVAIQATLASVLVLLGTFQQILNYFIFVTVVFLALTVAGLLGLRRREGIERYRIPGYPVTPFLFLTLVAVLLVLLGGHDPKQAALGVAVVALGIPVYLLVFRGKLTRNRNSPDDLDSHHPAARGGRQAALGD